MKQNRSAGNGRQGQAGRGGASTTANRLPAAPAPPAGSPLAASLGPRIQILRPPLFHYAAQRVGEDHADDAVQECLLRAWRLIEGYDDRFGDRGLYRWLEGILRHVLLEISRPNPRGFVVHDSGAMGEVAGSGGSDCGGREAESDSDPTLDAAMAAMQLELDRRTLIYVMSESNLTPQEWECFVARWSGEETRETATRLGVKPGTVRVAVNRALARLRAKAQDLGLVSTDGTEGAPRQPGDEPGV